MTKHQQQVDDEIHEDQLLKFLVNALTGEFGVSLGENVDLDPGDIYEVLVGGRTDGTSISTLCDRSEDSSSSTNILRHLRTYFDLDTVKEVGNTLLQEYTLDVLPEHVEIKRGVASGGGPSRSSFAWLPAQRGTLSQFGGFPPPTPTVS